MYTRDAVEYFGGKPNIVKTLGNRTKAAIYHWGDVVPLAAARQLETKSEGNLKVVAELYDEYGRIIRKTDTAA
jgi:hypothetical protein